MAQGIVRKGSAGDPGDARERLLRRLVPPQEKILWTGERAVTPSAGLAAGLRPFKWHFIGFGLACVSILLLPWPAAYVALAAILVIVVLAILKARDLAGATVSELEGAGALYVLTDRRALILDFTEGAPFDEIGPDALAGARPEDDGWGETDIVFQRRRHRERFLNADGEIGFLGISRFDAETAMPLIREAAQFGPRPDLPAGDPEAALRAGPALRRNETVIWAEMAPADAATRPRGRARAWLAILGNTGGLLVGSAVIWSQPAVGGTALFLWFLRVMFPLSLLYIPVWGVRRLRESRSHKGAIYAVTNQRALIYWEDRGRRVLSYDPSRIGAISTLLHSDGRYDVAFSVHENRYRGPRQAFLNLRDGPGVAWLLTRLGDGGRRDRDTARQPVQSRL